MKAEDFTYLASLLKRRSGYVLTREKIHLLSVRLKPVMERYGFKDLPALVVNLRHGHDMLARSVAEAMTINETSFFRDPPVFYHLYRKLLPDFMERRKKEKKLRIWCAAVASGQEAYSMAMILDDLGFREEGWAIDLIATDISPEMITRAESGLYASYEVERGIKAPFNTRYFRHEGDRYRIVEPLRRMVTFRTFNLLDSFGWLDDLDIVLCRNVLLYFDDITRSQTLGKVADMMRPDGVLLLGSAERPVGHSMQSFVSDRHGVYRKAENAVIALSA